MMMKILLGWIINSHKGDDKLAIIKNRQETTNSSIASHSETRLSSRTTALTRSVCHTPPPTTAAHQLSQTANRSQIMPNKAIINTATLMVKMMTWTRGLLSQTNKMFLMLKKLGIKTRKIIMAIKTMTTRRRKERCL